MSNPSMTNPFMTKNDRGHVYGAVCAEDRISMVKHFTQVQCRAALHVAGLQKTVATAIHRRLRLLEKAS